MKHTFIALVASALCLTASAQVKYMSTNTQKLNVEQLQDQAKTVEVGRYFFAGYNTLCLPMSMSAEQLAQAAPGVTLERLVAIRQEGSTLNLYFADCTADGIEAGMPYLVYSPKEQSLRFKNTDAMSLTTDLKAVRLDDQQGNMVTFSSSWEAIAKEGRYGIPAQQNVYPLESVLVTMRILMGPAGLIGQRAENPARHHERGHGHRRSGGCESYRRDLRPQRT